MNQPIAIVSTASISPLGQTSDEIWKNYCSEESLLTYKRGADNAHFVGQLPPHIQLEISKLRKENTKYNALDSSVLMALLVARSAQAAAKWNVNEVGINLGSSRGATQLFERYHKVFINTGKTDTLASPTTTLGNISSWVANDLQTNGPTLSHSITCSTGLHAVLNGVAWLQAGLATNFMVGASEAPLTPFTLAQMDALKIYSSVAEADPYPCRAMDFEKTKNTMVLGEGAGIMCLTTDLHADQTKLGSIIGIGYATEQLRHNTSISADGICFQKAMEMALKGVDKREVDAVILHTPGTVKGDSAEYAALRKVFPTGLPFLTNNKWKVGHTFATSGMLNMEMALLMIAHQHYLNVPFYTQNTPATPPKKIMVNSVGFGGNAVSILIGE